MFMICMSGGSVYLSLLCVLDVRLVHWMVF